MLKSVFANPVTRAFVTLLAAIAMVLALFIVYIVSPEHFGIPNLQLTPSTVYYFGDDWVLEYDYMKIKFPADSYVIPGYHSGQVFVVLIIAPEDEPGTLTLNLPPEHRGQLPGNLTDNLQQVVLAINPYDFRTTIRDSGDTILLMAPQTQLPLRQLERELRIGRDILEGYSLFGFENRLLPTPETILLQVKSDRLGTFTYYEDSTVRLISNTFHIEFSHPDLDRSYYPPGGYKVTIALYSLFLILTALSLAAFLTSGLEGSLPSVKGEYNPLLTTLALGTALVYAWLLVAYQQLFEPEHLWLAALWALGVAMVGVWMYRSRIPFSFAGLNWRGLFSGIPLSLVVAGVITLGAATRLPVGISLNPGLLAGLIATALLREALLRGFVQRIIAHWLSPTLAILLVAAAWTGITLSFGFTGDLILGGLSVLGKALLVGYVYQRTDNILVPGFLAGILEWLPLALIF